MEYVKLLTDELIELERNLSNEYHHVLRLNDMFNLDAYAELIRELTLREEL